MEMKDRIYTLHDETHKRIGTSSFFYIILIFSAFIVAFSHAIPTEKYVAIPFINIKMDRWNSVELLCLMSAFMGMRLNVFMSYLIKLQKELKNEPGIGQSFPTLICSLMNTYGLNYTKRKVSIFITFFTFSPVFFLHLNTGLENLAWRMHAGQGPFGVSWIMIATAIVVMSCISAYSFIVTTKPKLK